MHIQAAQLIEGIMSRSVQLPKKIQDILKKFCSPTKFWPCVKGRGLHAGGRGEFHINFDPNWRQAPKILGFTFPKVEKIWENREIPL